MTDDEELGRAVADARAALAALDAPLERLAVCLFRRGSPTPNPVCDAADWPTNPTEEQF